MCMLGRLLGLEGRADSGAWVMKVAGEVSSFNLKHSHDIIQQYITLLLVPYVKTFSSTWNVEPINLCRLYNCYYEVQPLFWCILSVSYPAASLSMTFFSGGADADKAKCWLVFLSEICRVAV